MNCSSASKSGQNITYSFTAASHKLRRSANVKPAAINEMLDSLWLFLWRTRRKLHCTVMGRLKFNLTHAWKNHNNQTYSCPRDWLLSSGWWGSIEGPNDVKNHSTIVSRGLVRPCKWDFLMSCHEIPTTYKMYFNFLNIVEPFTALLIC